MTDKRDWINENRKLWAKTFNVPIQDKLPPNFPAKTLYIMRHLAAVQELDGGDQKRLLEVFDAFFEGYWQRHEETFKPEVFLPILEKVLGRDDASKVAEAAGKEAKRALLENTEKAFRIGAFGLPWMVCENSQGEQQSFWGVDHLGQAANFLGLPQPAMPGWKAVL